MFSKKHEDIEFLEGSVRMYELSHADFEEVIAMENQSEQIIEFIFRGLADKPETRDEMYQWPASIINELSASTMRLNGLTEGN